MAGSLQSVVDSIVSATTGLPDAAALAQWSPDLSGDIDIRILRDGSWTHEGATISREGLVRVFASLLRREADGHYYLVTPVEKWRIEVEGHALLGIDCEQAGDDWQVLLNTGGRCRIGGLNRLHIPDDGTGKDAAIDNDTDNEPYIETPNGLTAKISRAAWYRLLDAAQYDSDRAYILSAGEEITLGFTH